MHKCDPSQFSAAHRNFTESKAALYEFRGSPSAILRHHTNRIGHLYLNLLFTAALLSAVTRVAYCTHCEGSHLCIFFALNFFLEG